MIGQNTLTLNQASLTEGITYWLNKTQFSSGAAIVIKAISIPSSRGGEVSLEIVIAPIEELAA